MAGKCITFKKCVLKLIPLQRKGNANTSTYTCNSLGFLYTLSFNEN